MTVNEQAQRFKQGLPELSRFARDGINSFCPHRKLAKLDFYGDDKYLYDTQAFKSFLSSLYKKEWVVYCKPPFKNANCVIEYLGRYTHRVAISNNRILKFENGSVSFKWRDYKDGSKWKVMTVSAEEFIRRFLIHILPPRFMKIRHYGLLGNRNKSTKLILCKILTFTKILKKEKLPPLELSKSFLAKILTFVLLVVSGTSAGMLQPDSHTTKYLKFQPVWGGGSYIYFTTLCDTLVDFLFNILLYITFY